MSLATLALKAPFPYFGGKAAVAALVWDALGQPAHYIEPFFGSGAVLLVRPDYNPSRHTESVCDADGFLANVWRALKADPDAVAEWADWPVNHADLNARRRRLLANEARLLENLTADDEWYDAKLAGYWIWAASCWIGAGLTRPNAMPHISDAGMGVHAIGQRPHITTAGMGVHGKSEHIYDWFRALATRLRRVRVVCGDWTRVCGGNWQDKIGTVGIFFDPPYGVSDRDTDVYHCDGTDIATAVSEWAVKRGDLPSYRIVVTGYDDEHSILTEAGWRQHFWSASGGYGNTARSDDETQGQHNRHRECLWFSPHCLRSQPTLFDVPAEPHSN